MHSIEPTVLLISPDVALCTAVRSALEQTEPLCHIAVVNDFAAARRTVADISPDVIVLEESSLAASQPLGSPLSPLEDVVSALAGFAPVVVLGQRQPPSLSALIAAGAADFVAGGKSAPAAAACVGKRLQSARKLTPDTFALRASDGEFQQLETFGELLRHELNNPLTGILGNSELLLAEVRRNGDTPISETGLKRLETIAALAVRLRETVRRLSQACETRSEQVRSA
jgi:signal transduction histidine kinase